MSRQEDLLTETLQQSLRPEPLPRLPDLNLAGRYLPASEQDAVGGDWYDVIPLSGGKVGIVIGDVVGSGTAAALRMGHLRDAVRAYALEGHGPSAIAERMNQFALSNRAFGGSTDATMATLVYAQLEADFATLRFVSAGHPPPLVRNPDRSVTFLEGAAAAPLGIAKHIRYNEVSYTLEPGAVLLLYTDGLVEGAALPLAEGLARLEQAVLQAPSDVEGLCDSILDSLLPGDGKADDDVALLALSPAPVSFDLLALTPSAEPESLAPIRYALGRWLRGNDLSEEEIYEVMVASGEACANAIEHAYPPGDASFDVEAMWENGSLTMTVRDQGRWRRPRGGEATGRGLELMRALMDSVEVNLEEQGTTVYLRRQFTEREPA